MESLRREVESERKHAELLSNQLEIKDNQIKAANEREQQTNVLMKDLHALMGDLQQRLPLPAGYSSPPGTTEQAPTTNVTDADFSEGNESKKVGPHKRKAGTRRKAVSNTKALKKATTSTAFPTFQRWFNTIRR